MNQLGHILVADDDEVFRNATIAVLKLRGFEAEGARDAAEAVRMLQAGAFDLLIADIHMPGNRDLEMLRDLGPVAPGLPVILATGLPSFQTAAQAVQLSVVAYLVKPFDPKEFLDLVAGAVERYRAFCAVRDHRRRLQNCCGDLEAIEGVLRTEIKTTASVSWSAFPAVALHTIVESLLDLQRYAEATAQQKNPVGGAGGEESPPPVVLVQALRETIAVLEKTKHAFKSKELGELRRRLEVLVPRPERPEAPKK